MYKADVLKHFKTSKAVAEALGITPAAVSQWNELVPPVSAQALALLVPELKFDPKLYRNSTLVLRRRAQALSIPS